MVHSFKINAETGQAEVEKLFNFGQNYHRGALRSVTMSDNDSIMATSSMDSVKVWNFDDRV